MSPRLDLLPPPKRVRLGKTTTRSRRVTRDINATGNKGPDAYRLTIAKSGIHLEGATEAALFYAEKTLGQIRAQFPGALPCLSVEDWADFPVRGFYHDVTRGKVPKLRTLLELAETCASYKLNHLELYVEHTYTFARHPEVWQGADPLTREEILALDARCAELHIDLVPSFSTFGHFYTWIRNKFPELNELGREASLEPYCWRDRMAHYTLDCQNPRSLALVREIIREVRPLFRSRFFNICADETFDLGNGRNKKLAEEIGKGRLYVDFLNKIMAIVREVDATPLFWGDVISHHPDVFGEIGPDAVALDWDYSARPDGRRSRLMQKHRRRFYVCPGTSGWEGWIPAFQSGHRNITKFAKHGLTYGASGLLNTDWGDFGHINTLGPTLPGLALGAACAWNARSPKLGRGRFSETVSRTIFGDSTGKVVGLLYKYASHRKAAWLLVCCAYQPHTRNFPKDWFQAHTGLPHDIFKLKRSAHETALLKMRRLAPQIEKLLARCRPKDPLLISEIRMGLLGQQLMEELFICYFERAGRLGRLPVNARKTAGGLRELSGQLHRVWHKRNKPSEFYRVEEVLSAAARDLAQTRA